MTDPATIPDVDEDPVFYPKPIATVNNGSAIVADAFTQIKEIIAGDGANCTKCKNALVVGQKAAQLVPSMIPDAMVALCEATKFASNATCSDDYQAGSFGAIYTQILALGDMAGLDGEYVCASLSTHFCKSPYALPSNPTFPKPKPSMYTIPKASGKRVKVLHMSDFHLDPRYDYHTESNCSSGLCCRPSTSSSSQVTVPAPLYGAFKCDTPYFLGTAALASIGPLTGTTHENKTTDSDQFAWTVYTGDLVSHDSQNQLSRNYTQYAEYSVYHMLKSYIPSGPIFPVLGNHDSNPEAIDAPHSLPGVLGQQQSWNYDHVSALWQQNNWISHEAAAEARMHYAAYSINHPEYPKLRIITLNTDFWFALLPTQKQYLWLTLLF